MDRMLTMILRRVIFRLVGRGVDAGINQVAKRRAKGTRASDDTRQS